MKEKVRDWYMSEFIIDELGAEIYESTTFASVLIAMFYGQDMYDIIGVSDSLMRERIFAEIAERMGVSYNCIYDIWLNSQK